MKILRDWTFKWWEVFLIKISLISVGILLGIYFTDILADFEALWWILFVAVGIYFIIRFFREK